MLGFEQGTRRPCATRHGEPGWVVGQGRGLLSAALLIMGSLLFASAYAQEEDAQAASRSDTTVDKIVDCLKQAREAMLSQEVVDCKPARTGRPFLDRRTPQPVTEDIEEICRKARTSPGADKRVLDPQIVNKIVNLAKNKIDTRGIRIIGGIFCNTIDLTGIDIPYSLVIDRSIVWGNIEARNFRTGGTSALITASFMETSAL